MYTYRYDCEITLATRSIRRAVLPSAFFKSHAYSLRFRRLLPPVFPAIANFAVVAVSIAPDA